MISIITMIIIIIIVTVFLLLLVLLLLVIGWNIFPVRLWFLTGLQDPYLRPHDGLHGVPEAAGLHQEQQRGRPAGPGVGRELRLPDGIQLHPVSDRAPVRSHPDRRTPGLQGLRDRFHTRWAARCGKWWKCRKFGSNLCIRIRTTMGDCKRKNVVFIGCKHKHRFRGEPDQWRSTWIIVTSIW